MSKQTNGRAAYTGAQIGRGIFAVRRHTYKPNTIRRVRRHCVITRVDEIALAHIDGVAKVAGITRGEAIGRITRACVAYVEAVKMRHSQNESKGVAA